MSETAADYFSRSNRRGSIVSDLDDLSIPDMDSVSQDMHEVLTGVTHSLKALDGDLRG